MRIMLATHRASNTYSGPTLGIRRSPDNAESDFYADYAGNLKTINGTSFASWIQGSGEYYVTKWYDQSGNAYNDNNTFLILRIFVYKTEHNNHAMAVNNCPLPVDLTSNLYVDLTCMSLLTGSKICDSNDLYSVTVKHASCSEDVIQVGSQFAILRCDTSSYSTIYYDQSSGVCLAKHLQLDVSPQSENIVSVIGQNAQIYGYVNGNLRNHLPTSILCQPRQGCLNINGNMKGKLYYLAFSTT